MSDLMVSSVRCARGVAMADRAKDRDLPVGAGGAAKPRQPFRDAHGCWNAYLFGFAVGGNGGAGTDGAAGGNVQA